jgi:uncharacterized protein
MGSPTVTPNPEHNVALVRSLYEAFAARDVPRLLAMLSPSVEWAEPANPFNPAAGTRRGHAGFLEWLRIGNEAEEVLVLEPRDFLANAQAVAVIGYARCRVRTTGREYATDFVHLVTLETGRVKRFQEFFDTYAAAEAFRNSQSGDDH